MSTQTVLKVYYELMSETNGNLTLNNIVDKLYSDCFNRTERVLRENEIFGILGKHKCAIIHKGITCFDAQMILLPDIRMGQFLLLGDGSYF